MTSDTPAPSLSGYWAQLRKPLELEVSRGCPDSAIVGGSIGNYARLWAQRLQDGADDDLRLAQSLARGLRDYAGMPAAERQRRAMAAIDLLRQREAQGKPATPRIRTAPGRKAANAPRAGSAVPPGGGERKTSPKTGKGAQAAASPPSLPLPVGHELLDMPVELLAPRARWPKLLAQKLHLYTVRDLLYHIPRDWVEVYRLRDLPDGARAAVVGTVARREYVRLKSKTSAATAL